MGVIPSQLLHRGLRMKWADTYESILKSPKHCINVKDDHTRMRGATNKVIAKLSWLKIFWNNSYKFIIYSSGNYCLSAPGFSHWTGNLEYRLLFSLGLGRHIAIAHPNRKKSPSNRMTFPESGLVNSALSNLQNNVGAHLMEPLAVAWPHTFIYSSLNRGFLKTESRWGLMAFTYWLFQTSPHSQPLPKPSSFTTEFYFTFLLFH